MCTTTAVSAFSGDPHRISNVTKRDAVKQMITSSKSPATTGYSITDIHDLSYATWESVKNVTGPLRELTWTKYHNVIIGSGVTVVSAGIAYIGYKAIKHISKKTNKEEEK